MISCICLEIDTINGETEKEQLICIFDSNWYAKEKSTCMQSWQTPRMGMSGQTERGWGDA